MVNSEKSRVYIGLGSNLAEPIEQVVSARAEIAALEGVSEVAFSSLYSSPPMGPQDQPDYINAVMAANTSLTPLALLKQLQSIENRHNRVRLERWGARTLDLDILIYGDRQIDSAELIVPHIGIAERAFVLYPMAEIADPELFIPGKGLLSDLLARCPRDGLRRLDA